MTSRRAQLHLSETIAVLFIFFVLVLFGLLFYYKYQQVAVKERQEELLAARAMDTTLKVLFLPELICSKGDAEPEDNCFDLLKLRSVDETFKDHLEDYYFNIFSYSTITVYQVYPETSDAWVLYSKTKPEFPRVEPTYFIVSLRDETRGVGEPQYGFGVVKVEVYS